MSKITDYMTKLGWPKAIFDSSMSLFSFINHGHHQYIKWFKFKMVSEHIRTSSTKLAIIITLSKANCFYRLQIGEIDVFKKELKNKILVFLKFFLLIWRF